MWFPWAQILRSVGFQKQTGFRAEGTKLLSDQLANIIEVERCSELIGVDGILK